MGEYDMKHDGCDIIVKVMDETLEEVERERNLLFVRCEVERIRQETIQFAIHEEEEDGVDGVDGVGGEVMIFNTMRIHAMVIGQVLQSAL